MSEPKFSLQRTAGLRFSRFAARWPAAAEFRWYALLGFAMRHKSFMSIVAAGSMALLSGCSHYSKTISATQSQLDDYRDRAVARLRSDGLRKQVWDLSRPIEYEFCGGSHPQIAIIIPVVSAKANEFVRVEFNSRSGDISTVLQVTVH